MRNKFFIFAKVSILALLLAVPAKYALGNIPDDGGDADEGDNEAFDGLDEREGQFPTPSTQVMAQWDGIRATEAIRWKSLLPGGGQLAAQRGMTLTSAINPQQVAVPWLNIGPSNILTQSNGAPYEGFDSGRSVALVVDPRDPNVVYNATCMGGIWKTNDFVASMAAPHWHSITDGLPDLSFGAFAVDPLHPDTLYAVTGDPFESHSGVSVYKSLNGGATWQAPVPLIATYASLPAPYRPNSARDIKIDPKNPSNLLVATSAGLFRSTDAGATFTFIDLPNGPNAIVETTWSIAYVGGTTWLVTGIGACAAYPYPNATSPILTLSYPPGAGRAREVRTTQTIVANNCPLGNLGDIWRSTDGGATWSSSRYAASGSLFPALPANANEVARITLAAGNTADPSKTAVYAYVGNTEAPLSSKMPHRTIAFWRSRDGGQTWADATGKLANPTFESGSCIDMNVGHGQTWYNQAIGVDPTNDDNVLVGGNLCGVRTLSGTSTTPQWENVSFWLNTGHGSFAGSGRLPYAHADWHVVSMAQIGGKTRVLVGNDGGFYSSGNVFDPKADTASVLWSAHNKGLVTHLAYAIGSGDPITDNGFLALMGLQDNGTWSRAIGETGSATLPYDYSKSWPTIFKGVHGGDGIGSAVSTGTVTDGSGAFMDNWFVSAASGYSACDNWFKDCTDGNSYFNFSPPSVAARSDTAPFLVYYATVPTDPTATTTLTLTTHQIWKTQITGAIATPDGGAGDAGDDGGTTSAPLALTTPRPEFTATSGHWVAASPDFRKMAPTGVDYSVTRPFAARKLPNVIGGIMSVASGAATKPPCAINSDGSALPASWTLCAPLPSDSAGRYLPSPSAIDFPNAVSPGKQPGDELIITSNAPFVSDGSTPVADDLGHIFKTTDRGQTWIPIHGSSPMTALPNVPIFIAKYDPMDATSQTIYVGTLIGVYVTTNGGDTWSRFGSDLPMLRVSDLYIASNDEFLRIATYGRGLWEINPSATAPHGVDGDGDYDLNEQIDWRDVAALSSRLGTTPATTTPPLYSFICDLTTPAVTDGTAPTAAKIKEADLTALLNKFAGHP